MINSWKIIVGIRVICCDMQFMQITVFFLDRGNEVLQKIFSKTLLLLKRCAPKISFKLLKLKIENMKKKSMKISSDRAFIFQTVAEYRNECRNEISEWFATLNRLEGAEWLIVFDSMKAREQKNRGALMERIKSDFSKFTNRSIRIQILVKWMDEEWSFTVNFISFMNIDSDTSLLEERLSSSPDYELCAQLLSSQPGAILCRVDDACDMIVSLRSLTNRVETVVVGIDADPCFWTISQKHKLVHVKESGLGQISFTVFPKMIGFLPYPIISVYSCRHKRSDSVSGFFVRTNGKQVHVLGAFPTSSDSKSNASVKTNRLKEAKSRITKLFD
uniref:Bm7049, isoform c n=1 Tax=Brugia malayi TaxID=6279 RepID=A0A1I9G045_BRUMA|nr:Bm7049, isoform c [Brugia malayi]